MKASTPASYQAPIRPQASADKDGFKVPYLPSKGVMSNARVVTPIEERAVIKAQFEKLKCNERLDEVEGK